jgi:hypothetical protein
VPDPSLNEELIIDYLLGDLPESETERLDELSIADDEFAEFLLAIENDLVDAYVRGELSEHKRARFQSHYLASSKRREKVAFAQTFLNHADKASIAQQKETVKKGFVPSSAFQWGAIAAALVMLLLGGYFLLSNIQLRRQIAQMKEEHAALKQREQQLQRDLFRHGSSDREKEKEIALARDKLEALERQLADHGSAPVKVFAFTFSPQERGISSLPKLVIPAKTESLVVTLKLESSDFPLYEAALKDPGTEKVLWRSGKLKSRNQSVTVKFPASILNSQNYVVEISGISRGGNAEIISGYPFHVVIQ